MHSSRAAEASSAHASRSDRSQASHRAEDARRDWDNAPASERPLARGTVDAANALDAVLYEAWCEGDARASNVCLARDLGVDEKQIRQYRDGRKRLPVAALYEMPVWLADRLLARMAKHLHVGERDAASAARRAVTALAASVTRENAAVVRAAVRDLQREILELDTKLDEVTR